MLLLVCIWQSTEFHFFISTICKSFYTKIENSDTIPITFKQVANVLSSPPTPPSFDVSKLIKLPQYAGSIELGPTDIKYICAAMKIQILPLISNNDRVQAKKCQITVAYLTSLAQVGEQSSTFHGDWQV